MHTSNFILYYGTFTFYIAVATIAGRRYWIRTSGGFTLGSLANCWFKPTHPIFYVEVTVGFEPTNNAVAARPLKPLEHVTTILGWLRRHIYLTTTRSELAPKI